jgi:hypothetical protein
VHCVTSPKRPTICLYGCGLRMPATELEPHVLSGQCKPLRYPCDKCGSRPLFTSFELLDHLTTCRGLRTGSSRKIPAESKRIEPPSPANQLPRTRLFWRRPCFGKRLCARLVFVAAQPLPLALCRRFLRLQGQRLSSRL